MANNHTRLAQVGGDVVYKLTRPVALAFILSIVLLIFGEIISPGFASYSQIINILVVSSFLGMVAGGQNLVIINGRGSIDLSVGQVMTLGAIIGGNIVNGTNDYMVLAVIVVLASCFFIGVMNGIGATTFNIPPLVMTLGMGGVVRGIILYLTRGAKVGTASPFMVALVNDRWIFGIPGVLFVWAAFTALMVYLLRNTRYGISLFAIGANEPAARLSGVAIKKMKVLTFGLSSLIAGFTGFVMLGFTKTVYTSMGDWYNLPSVIAVVIGGTALSGGIGGYTGTVAGAIVLILLRSILTTLNIPEFGRQIIFGLVLVVLMFAYGRQRKLRE